MPQTFGPFPSRDRRRQILVADDELVNREILGAILQEEYDILFAADGTETLEMIRQHRDTLSLVLLDILMPGMTGIEVLKAVKNDESVAKIPIVVITSEQKAEVESLRLGAIDFIPKPYPDFEVVRARVQKTIELSEDRQTILSTERDALTGLYSREYFYRYAKQYDQFHPEEKMDAILIDVNHFRMLNERYGKAFGDKVLRTIAARLLEAEQTRGGIFGRRGADIFMVYCPHTEEHKALLDFLLEGIEEDGSSGNRVRLRMGVYPDVDKGIEVERRLDRAKMASDLVRGSFAKIIGYYDAELHERELYAEQLIEDFPAAIAENQFRVFYQPKFDIRPDTPILTGAEALVRWQHPKLGLVSPGVFIPLFEENGLIQELDSYVWREAARQIQEWKSGFDFAVPVSVNVSRIDLFDANLVDTLRGIAEEFKLNPADLRLEVTESAYTQNSEQIVAVVEELRNLGFQIEMDDFGSGYSSLNMLSSLPIDGLKLDMQFVRNAFRVGGNTHLLEIIIDISDYLSVPVIAEGVETEEQLDTLRTMGCDIVQGYFFSKPVPAAEFEAFILQRKEAAKAEKSRARTKARELLEQGEKPPEKTETTGKTEPESKTAWKPSRKAVKLRTANFFFAILAFFAAIALFVSDYSLNRGYQRMEQASDRYIAAQLSASDMESGSDYLTDRVRCFVVTGDIGYLHDFFEEINVTRRRDLAVENLGELLGDSSRALASLNRALTLSNELVETEYQAMLLALEAGNYDWSAVPDELKALKLSPEDQALTPADKLEKARNILFDDHYMQYKDRIRENVRQCTETLIASSREELEIASSRMAWLVRVQTGLTVLFLLLVSGIVAIISQQIRKPLTNMVRMMQNQELIEPTGAEELRFVTRTYNTILKENKEARERLSHEASHDALTGLFNRGAYDMLMQSVDREHMALILVDVDYFKSINDTYGHAVGDRVLQRVAEILQKSFRSVDILCRIGGDEFVVVMTRANSSMRQLVENKFNRANDLLQHPKDGLPPVSLSVGVAFSDRENPQGDIFADADAALYQAKEAGRCCCAFYE